MANLKGCGRKLGPYDCCTVVCGDCLELMKALPNGCVDAVITDPPYGHNNNDGDLIHNWEAALGRPKTASSEARPIANDGPEEASNLVRHLFSESKRLLDEGCCCCCCGGGPDPQFARWSLWMDEILGFKMCVVWDKGGLGMGWHYRRNWECVLVSQTSRWFGGNSIPNLVRFPKIIPQADEHPTMKPVELFAFFINNHTEEGDLVLDPFLGSGTTAVAAKKLGRHFLGFEISPEYCKIAEERIALVEAQPNLFEKKAEQLDLVVAGGS